MSSWSDWKAGLISDSDYASSEWEYPWCETCFGGKSYEMCHDCIRWHLAYEDGEDIEDEEYEDEDGE